MLKISHIHALLERLWEPVLRFYKAERDNALRRGNALNPRESDLYDKLSEAYVKKITDQVDEFLDRGQALLQPVRTWSARATRAKRDNETLFQGSTKTKWLKVCARVSTQSKTASFKSCSRAVSETAVITKIFFNADEEKVTIYKRDKVDADGQPPQKKCMILKIFLKNITLTIRSEKNFCYTVNHVELFLKINCIVDSVVQFVDSPSTQASLAGSRATTRKRSSRANFYVEGDSLIAADNFSGTFDFSDVVAADIKKVDAANAWDIEIFVDDSVDVITSGKGND